MDAIQLLTDQHRMLEERLDAAVDATDPRERAALAAEAGDQLAVHVTAEETLFYPAVKAHRSQAVAPESLAEHAALKRRLADLLELSAEDPDFEARLKALREEAARHHGEEEARLFPQVRRCMLGEELEVLGQAMLACQKRLLRAGQPRETVADQAERTATL